MMYKVESTKLAQFDRIKKTLVIVFILLLLGSVGLFSYEKPFDPPEEKSLAIWAVLSIATLLVGSVTRFIYVFRPNYICRIYQDPEAAQAVIHGWCPCCLGIDSILCPFAPVEKKSSKRAWFHHGIKVGRVTESRLFSASLSRENPKLKRSLDQAKKSLAMFYARKVE